MALDSFAEPFDLPAQSPLFHARNAERYDRQSLIDVYQTNFSCRLIVMIDEIYSASVTFFEELLYDADSASDLHLLLASPGGDGETALRLVRAAQARCRELTVIIPDQAKSAATLFALGAHHILMGPASDLGPIDPQILIEDEFVSAKDVIAAVDDATRRVQEAPDTYPIHASLLAELSAIHVQEARSALARTADQLDEALHCNPDRTKQQVSKLKGTLKGRLIEDPKSHAALFGVQDAIDVGLPTRSVEPQSDRWRLIWLLWTTYFKLGPEARIYEGSRVSFVSPDPEEERDPMWS